MYGIDINHPAPLQGYPNEMVFLPGALPLAIFCTPFGGNDKRFYDGAGEIELSQNF